MDTLKLLKEIFTEFYTLLLDDEHSADFLTSFLQIKTLLDKQAQVLKETLQRIKNREYEKAKEDFYRIAKRHYELGISPKAMFDAINLYTELLKEKAPLLNLKGFEIALIKNLLLETTAKVYTKGYLEDAISFLQKEREFRISNAYDDYFYTSIVSHLEKLKKALEGKESSINFNLFLHTNCDLIKYLKGIGFQIISFGVEREVLELKALHRLVHLYSKDLISYLRGKRYKETVYTVSNIIDNVYKLLHLYSNISLRWREGKREIVASYTLSRKGKRNLYLLVAEYRKDIKISQNIKEEILALLKRYFKDFRFIFFEEIDGSVNIFLNKDAPDFEIKLNHLIEDFKKLSERLWSKYVSLIDKPILKIAKFDLDRLTSSLSEEEVTEFYKEIERRLKMAASQTQGLIEVIDFTPLTEEILSAVRQTLDIKRISLQQLKKENVDLFVHKIFNLTRETFGIEILGRIKNPATDTYIPAGKFIKIFEENNLMGEFDEAIIKNVRKALSDLKKIAPNLFVNIYPTSLTYEPVVKELIKLIGECEKENVNLFLELTEYAIISNKEILKELESEKFAIAFDDFGTGYTNYEIIGELGDSKKAKVVKIDGSIVRNMLSSKVYESILESITLFACKIGMKTVYEFVENEEILNRIKEVVSPLGIEPQNLLLQGYYLHKPTHYKEELKTLTSQKG